MSVNRYTNLNWSSPIRQEIPVPFNELAAIGDIQEKKFIKAKQAIDTSLDPFAKLDLTATLKHYGEKGIQDTDLGLQDYKNQVVNDLNKERDILVNRLSTGEITSKDPEYQSYLSKATNAYNQLSQYEQVAKDVRKRNEEVSKNEAFGRNTAYGTKYLEDNTRFLKDLQEGKATNYNPFGIAKEHNSEESLNKHADNWYKSDFGSKAYLAGDYIEDIETKGITSTRVYDYANRIWNDPNTSERAYAELELNHYLRLNNLTGNEETTYKDYKRDQEGNILKDKQGKSVLEEKTGKIADLFLEDKKKDFAASLADKIVHIDYKENLKADPFDLQRKRFEREDTLGKIKWTIQSIPVDPLNPTANDEGLNANISAINPNFSKYWKFKDGKLQLNNNEGQLQAFVNIDGKEYNINSLPEGYKKNVKQGEGLREGIPTITVQDKNGKTIKIETKEVGKPDQEKAYKELSDISKRLGLSGKNNEENQQVVEDYYLTSRNFQMNFTMYDEGAINAFSRAFGVKLKQDKDGNSVIENPGKLAFSTIKDKEGNLITGEELSTVKTQILNGAKLLGPSQSITNDNIQAGDTYIQANDGDYYIINTNNKTYNKANEPATYMTKSIDRFVQTGETPNDPDLKKLNEATKGNFTSIVYDKSDNMYASFVRYIPDETGKKKLTIGVLKNDNPIPISLDEANKEITQSYMTDILPTVNPKNFERATKSDTYEEDNIPD